MARNETHTSAAPEVVWAVLSDGSGYAEWVVGAKEIRKVDASWPAEGALLHHSVGVGPAKLKDNTVVLESRPPRWLKMRGRFRPIGIAHITFELVPDGDGTTVVMYEDVVGGIAARFYGRFMSALMRGRNAETLRRLKNLAER